MKLIRFGAPGKEKPGLWMPGGRMVDVTSEVDDYNEAFFGGGGLGKLRAWLDSDQADPPPIPVGSRIGAPIARPSKIICIGLNYRDHAEESGAEVPAEPILFSKATSHLCGPFDDVVLPMGSEKTDWEVELAVVISRRASHVLEEDALDYVAGFAVHNDYSEREFQLERGGQWVKGKSADTFAPLGPYLVTPDEISDVNALGVWLTVNGETVQRSSTKNLIFGVPELISYISRFMTLLPGDVISTGTPGGVGAGMKPPRYLKAGDEVELGIDGLGTARQKVVPFGG